MLAVVRWAHRHAPMRRAAPVIHHDVAVVMTVVMTMLMALDRRSLWHQKHLALGAVPGYSAEFQDAWGSGR